MYSISVHQIQAVLSVYSGLLGSTQWEPAWFTKGKKAKQDECHAVLALLQDLNKNYLDGGDEMNHDISWLFFWFWRLSANKPQQCNRLRPQGARRQCMGSVCWWAGSVHFNAVCPWCIRWEESVYGELQVKPFFGETMSRDRFRMPKIQTNSPWYLTFINGLFFNCCNIDTYSL
jgi:hypothetical protein